MSTTGGAASSYLCVDWFYGTCYKRCRSHFTSASQSNARETMRFSISAVAAVMGSALFAASTHAAVIGYTGTGATAGTNSGNLNIGRQFSVTGTGITLRDLGVWDSGGDGLVNSHAVQLFTITSGAG